MVVVNLNTLTLFMILLVQSQTIESVTYNHPDCRYQFHNQTLTWNEAYNVCKNKNMTLLQLTTDKMTTIQSLLQSKVNHLIDDSQISSAWIGLHATRQSDGVHYFWPGCLQPTSTGHLTALWQNQSAMCGVFGVSSTTYDLLDCETALPFVCEETESDTFPCFMAHSDETEKYGCAFDYEDHDVADEGSCAEFCFDSAGCACYVFKSSLPSPCRFGIKNTLDKPYYINNIVDWYSYTSVASTIPPEDVCSIKPSMTDPLASSYLVTSSASFKPQTTSVFSLHPSTFSYDTYDSSSLDTPSLPTISYTTLSSSLTSVLPSASLRNCPCHLVSISNVTYTPEELQQKIEQIKSELTIPTKKTNKYKRSLISAPDNRPSARRLGSLGAVIIGIIITMLVAFDFPRAARSSINIARKAKMKFSKQSA